MLISRYSLWAAVAVGASVIGVVGYRHQPRFWLGHMSAANGVLSSDPRALLTRANQLYWGHNLPAAAPLYVKAEQLFNQAHDERDALYAAVGRIRSQDAMSFPEISAFLAEKVKTPLVQDDPTLRLWCFGVKGDVDDEINPAAAKEDWEQVGILARALGQKQWANRANGELGLVGFLQGDSKGASWMLGHALLTAVAEGDDGTAVRYYELIGNGLNVLNRPWQATVLLNRAVSIAHDDPTVGTPFMAYEGKAEALSAQNHLDQAQRLMEQTLAEARKEKMWEHEGQDLLILGEFSRRLGNQAQARQYLEEAAQSAQKVGLPRVVEASFFDLSELSQQEGNLQQAEVELERGLQVSRSIGDTYYLPLKLDALAELKARMGQTEEAHALYQEAVNVVEAMLLNVPGAYMESSLLSSLSDTFLGDFEVAAGQHEIGRAFDAIERARGRAVADNLASRHTGSRSVNTNPSLQQRISTLQLELYSSNDPAKRQKLLEELDVDEESLGYFGDLLDPEQRHVATQPIGLPLAQRKLSPDEAVLEYVLAEPSSFCLAFTRNDAAIVKIPADRKRIAQLAAGYLVQVAGGKYDSSAAATLESLLIDPIPESLRPPRLVIVPDGILHDLPFEALKDGTGQYLLKSHLVSYAPSTTVLCALRSARGSHEPQMAFLGIGDVPYDLEPNNTGTARAVMRAISRGVYDISGSRLYDLPASRQEVIEASNMLQQPSRTILLLGADATESKFKSEALANFRIIHFAVHSWSAPEFPERSALILGRDPHSDEDGLLQAREITRLSLAADLVTLSACDTGKGELEEEAGTTGLVEAFLLAGAKSVVASLWEVDDYDTQVLMKQFYTHLAHGQDEVSALRQSKIDYLAEVGDRPPISWAAFILVGDGSAPITF